MQCKEGKNKTKELLETSRVVGASQQRSLISSSWQKLSFEYLIGQWWYACVGPPQKMSKMQNPFGG